MELRIDITVPDSTSVHAGITEEGLELRIGTQRRISFKGSFGDISVKFIKEGEGQPSAPAMTEEAVTAVDDRMDEVPGSPVEAVPQSTGEATTKEEDAEVSEPLFDRLTALRRLIASEAKLPPYIIFHDSTLLEMCRVLPKDLQELKTIQGIGEAKLTKYGQRFLDCIREYTMPGQPS